jgi:transposase InsO family protein
MDELTPKDPAEAIALYRAQIVGPLVRGELGRGDLRAALIELTKQRFRAPRAHSPQSYSLATLERWYYAFRDGGLDALRPRPRKDKGRARDLTDEQKELLVAIREEHPHASVSLIVDTLVADGRLERDAVSTATVRRLFADRGLDRVSLRGAAGRGKIRLRWQAERPGALWQGDVCHAQALRVGQVPKPVRIHALLDDASRYVVALEAMHSEREVDMLALLVRALRKYGPPDALYLDNGSTYRGQALSLACARMGTALVHPRPYDAPARGKMERFWRTLRERCLDFVGSCASLHDVNVRLWAFLDEHYHRSPHAALMGKTPAEVFASAARPADSFDEARLIDALTVRARRRVRRDNTLAMDGQDWETSLHFLAGRLVTVARSLAEPDAPPWIEHEGKRFALAPVDPIRNARRSRSVSNLDAPHPARVTFDPPAALLDRAVGRTCEPDEGDDKGGAQ